MAQWQSLLARSRMQALSTPNTSLVKRVASASFRQRCASALMHPVTLVALAVLLVNDLLFKALWPGAWVPGKLSDLAWMVFAPPVLAYILSFATTGRAKGQRAAFVAAYAGLPLLYVAFNTFAPVHDAILLVLGLFGGDGPRSPLDATDSMVIPFAMAAAIWVWRRPPMEAQSLRTRLALLAATAAALASVASSYSGDWGIKYLGETDYGTPGTSPSGGSYVSLDGGLTWKRTSERFVPTKRQQWIELDSDAAYMANSPNIIGERRELDREDLRGVAFIVDNHHFIGEESKRELEQSSGVFSTWGIRISDYEIFGSGEVIYSFEHLQSRGNRWIQALDKRDVHSRVITTRPLDVYYDDQSDNIIVAMGLQGVVVVAPDGTTTQVAVGRFSPTDFSFGGKVRTFFSSLLHGDTVGNTGLAFLFTFSFSALALASPARSTRSWYFLAVAAAISAVLAVFVGVYPHVVERPWDNMGPQIFFGILGVPFSVFGFLPGWVASLFVVVGLVFLTIVRVIFLDRTSRRQLLAIFVASIGLLLLIWGWALVLFETGPLIANSVAVGMVGLAAFGLWAHQKRRRSG